MINTCSAFLQVKEHSVNLIFAVTEEQFGVYDLLKKNIEGSSAGTLSNDSSNIVELVKAQYQAITSSIEMKDNLQKYLDSIPGQPKKYECQVSAIRGTVSILKRCLGTKFK